MPTSIQFHDLQSAFTPRSTTEDILQSISHSTRAISQKSRQRDTYDALWQVAKAIADLVAIKEGLMRPVAYTTSFTCQCHTHNNFVVRDKHNHPIDFDVVRSRVMIGFEYMRDDEVERCKEANVGWGVVSITHRHFKQQSHGRDC
jgi:hypothetical protein